MNDTPPTILVVHHDPVAAIEFAYAVSDAGGTVLGPFTRAADALLAMIGADVDCALLDCSREDPRIPVLVEQLDLSDVPVVVAVSRETPEDVAVRYPYATIAGAGAERLAAPREPQGVRLFQGWMSGERRAVRAAVEGLVVS